MMKKHLLSIVSAVCLLSLCNVHESYGFRKTGSRKKSRGLASYFNLYERADAQDSNVAEDVVQESALVEGTELDDIDAPLQDMGAESTQPESIAQEDESMQTIESDAGESEAPLEMVDSQDDPYQDEQSFTAIQEEPQEEMHAEDDSHYASDMHDKQPVDLPGAPTIHRDVYAPVDTDTTASMQELTIDIQKKRDATVQLVNRAAEFFDAHSAEEAFNTFSHTKDFIDAELYIFSYTHDGVCVAHPHSPEHLWQNMYDMKDSYGRHPVRGAIRKADEGGGWITYEWEGATKLTYCKEVTKDDKKYVLAAGFYSHSKRDSVVNLVKSAVVFFKSIIQHGFSPMIAFSAFSYPVGNFVHGDLYTYTIGFDGVTYAHGDDPGLVGSDAIEVQDSAGTYINKEIIKALKNTTSEGVWIDYISKRAPKKVYAEKVKDQDGNEYFIACGYYPDADRDHVVDLVRKAYNFMKSNGKSIAARDFTDPKNDDFRYGDLYIFMYDTKGVCVAQGNNPSLVGKNRFDLQDSDGRYYVQEFIKKAQEGGGWVNYKVNKLYRAVYVELIDMGVDQYIIGSGLYPISKRETMELMVKSAASYLETGKTTEVLRDFVKRDSKFKRGDLSIFVLEDTGTCLAYGDEYDLIWRNLMRVEDDNQNPFVRQMIEMSRHGAGLVRYKLNNAPKVSYIEPVHKDGKNYIVGSGYYL